MIRPGRKLTRAQRTEIRSVAIRVKARRLALGLTQTELDRECGFVVRTVDRVERRDVGHRSFLPDDERVETVLRTLDRLESSPKPSHSKPYARSSRPSIQQTPVDPDSTTLEVTLRLCPDHDLMTTQAGCESMIRTNPVCRSLNGGRGCRGVAYRKDWGQKHVKVEYTPPKPGELEYDGKRWRRTGEG